ncbi:hypothetical protein [Gudongella sp. DL1XJH-153]|uniref:hypothetical protein n=1 Tax=Gudongella sp. DL1XJH-153 TaxID=3409804 RepID=UPI003BB71C05
MTKGIDKSIKGTTKTKTYQNKLTFSLVICLINPPYSSGSCPECKLRKAAMVGLNPPTIKKIKNIGCPILISVVLVT